MALHIELRKRIVSIVLALFLLVAVASAIDFVGGVFDRLWTLSSLRPSDADHADSVVAICAVLLLVGLPRRVRAVDGRLGPSADRI